MVSSEPPKTWEFLFVMYYMNGNIITIEIKKNDSLYHLSELFSYTLVNLNQKDILTLSKIRLKA